MADTTPSGLPYPELSDDNNPPADILALALAIESIMQKSVANIAALPVTPAYKGQRIYVEDLDVLVWYDDKTTAWQGYWKSYTPTIVGTASPALAFEYMIESQGNTVRVRPNMTLTAGLTGALTATLPVDPHASYTVASTFPGSILYRDTSAGSVNRVVGWPIFVSTNVFSFSYAASSATNTSVQSGTGAPFTAAWASGDTIDGEFSYRRA